MQIVFISDTHGLHASLPSLPEADVLVHAGDFMNSGTRKGEIESFNNWLGTLRIPKERRLICAGNHDIAFDASHVRGSATTAEEAKKLLFNGTYLQDQEITVDGVKFYLSPWTPFFLGWGFNRERGEEIKKYWDRIPLDTDVLVTHGPPYGILDKPHPEQPFSDHTGCEELRKAVDNIKPKIHIFGHIHGSRGSAVMGDTTFINASFLTERYVPHSSSGYFLVNIETSDSGKHATIQEI